MSGILYYFNGFISLLSDKSYAIVTLILLLPFLIAFAICAPLFMVKAFKRGFWRALLLLAGSILSFILAGVGAKLLSMLISSFFGDKLLEAANRAIEAYSVGGGHSPERLAAFGEGLISALIALVLYFVFFILFLLIIRKLLYSLTKRRSDRKRPTLVGRILGLVIGAVDALLVALLLFAPLYTFVYDATQTLRSSVSDVISSPVADILLEGQEEQVKAYEEKIDAIYQPIVNCPVTVVCSRPVFNFGRSVFGLYSYNGRILNAYDELEYYIDDSLSPAQSGEKNGLSALGMLESVLGKEPEKDDGSSLSVKKIIGNLLSGESSDQTSAKERETVTE